MIFNSGITVKKLQPYKYFSQNNCRKYKQIPQFQLDTLQTPKPIPIPNYPHTWKLRIITYMKYNKLL